MARQKEIDKRLEKLELGIVEMLESVLDGQHKSLKYDRCDLDTDESSFIATEKQSDGGENFDGWLPLCVNQRYLYMFSLAQLREIRDASRVGVMTTEIGKNIERNYVDNIIGPDLIFTIDRTDVMNDPVKLAASLNGKADKKVRTMRENWKKICRKNKMSGRWGNIVERSMRDGENFIRITKSTKRGDNVPNIRFVDPWFIAPGKDCQWGIIHTENDIEDVTGYNYDKSAGNYEGNASGGAYGVVTIPAEQMVFIKRNVDFESPRGIPDYWPVLGTMRRVEKTLTNTSVMVQIQSAIALVREFTTSSQEQVNNFVNKQSDGKTRTVAATGQNVQAKNFQAGTILNGGKDTKYNFPASTVDPSKYTAVADRDLAQIASRFVLPVSWLLGGQTELLNPGDPTVSNFRKEQKFFYTSFEELFWKCQAMMGVDVDPDDYELLITGPRLAFGNVLDEARADQIRQACGAMSSETIATQAGLSYNRERARTIAHVATLQPGEVVPGTLGNTDPNNDGNSKNQGNTRGPKGANADGGDGG